MATREQSAIQGVASAGAVNFVARVLAFASHVAITAFFGLSGELDAYFVALTVVSLSFLTLGDGFDSVGVAPLVRAMQQEGEARFRELAGALLVLAVIVSCVVTVIVAALLPWAHYVAPGLKSGAVPLVTGNLIRLAPFGILYLPCRAAASVLRSRRRFVEGAAWEAFGAAATLAALLLLPGSAYMVAVASSVGALAGAAVLVTRVRPLPRLSGARLAPDVRQLGRALLSLLPIYALGQLFRVSDRAFASFLPEGAIAAISYGQMLVLIPGAVLVLENTFMTPLAETDAPAPLVRRIIDGVLCVSIPPACFIAAFSDLAVAAAFERGRFDAAASALTGAALQGFVLALPALLTWPVFMRVFQVLGRPALIFRLAVAQFVLHFALSGAAVVLGLGVRGLALATTVAAYGITVGGVILLKKQIGGVVSGATAIVALQVATTSGIGLIAAWLVPTPATALPSLAVKAIAFFGTVALLLAVAPAPGIREFRSTVLADLLAHRRGRE
jgi:putative peptidoglycan lipid II flippase